MKRYRPGAMLSGVRKAFASIGDDVTFSRFVKLKPGEIDPTTDKPRKKHAPKVQWKLPGMSNPSIEAGRSLFYRKGVKPVIEMNNVLVSGHSNVKIGRDVRKGKLFRGYWIYTLSLEERATCPRSCEHWQTCYGNNMPWAKRVSHEDSRALYDAIERDIKRLLAVKGRAGILVRLHALGDFFDIEYVYFWQRMLKRYDRLAIFGYTARLPGTLLGDAIEILREQEGARFAVRTSNNPKASEWSTRTVVEAFAATDAIQCPEQIGASDGCGKCGLCWNTNKNVAFINH